MEAIRNQVENFIKNKSGDIDILACGSDLCCMVDVTFTHKSVVSIVIKKLEALGYDVSFGVYFNRVNMVIGIPPNDNNDLLTEIDDFEF